MLPPLIPADWQAWVLGLLQTFLRQAPGVAAGSGGGANATAAGTQLLFSFSPEGGSVPAEQRSIGYRLLRWACPGGGLGRAAAGGAPNAGSRAELA